MLDGIQLTNFEDAIENSYFIARGQVKADERSYILHLIKQFKPSQGCSLFSSVNKRGKVFHSLKRKQYDIMDGTVLKICKRAAQQQLGEGYEAADPVAIVNGKCKAQPPHVDIADDSDEWQHDIPFAALMAIEDDTSILLMKDSIEDHTGELQEVMLDAGDVLFMHGLCVHAGNSYSQLNRRVHFMALKGKSLQSRPLNQTFLI